MYVHLEKLGEERTVNNLTQSLVTPHGLRFISNQYIIYYQMEKVTHVTFKQVMRYDFQLGQPLFGPRFFVTLLRLSSRVSWQCFKQVTYPSFQPTFNSLYSATAAMLRIAQPRKHGPISGSVQESSLLCRIHNDSRANQASHSKLYGAIFWDVNGPVRPFDYSYLSSAERRNTQRYTSILLYNFLLCPEVALWLSRYHSTLYRMN